MSKCEFSTQCGNYGKCLHCIALSDPINNKPLYKPINSNDLIKFNKFKTDLLNEIKVALQQNYDVKQLRLNKTDYNDNFVNYCNGKIDCLRGLQDFIESYN